MKLLTWLSRLGKKYIFIDLQPSSARVFVLFVQDKYAQCTICIPFSFPLHLKYLIKKREIRRAATQSHSLGHQTVCMLMLLHFIRTVANLRMSERSLVEVKKNVDSFVLLMRKRIRAQRNLFTHIQNRRKENENEKNEVPTRRHIQRPRLPLATIII